jgi:thymidylate kinase
MLTASNPRPAPSTNGSARGELLADLAGRLHDEGVRYCHWKGTFNVHRIRSGEGDADLLVHRQDAGRFEMALAALGLKRAIDPLRPRTPSVAHFYGLDQASGVLIHLHVYYRLVTGQPLLDNYTLPLEELLLHNTVLIDGMHVAEPTAALTVFVCRIMLTSSSVSECLLRRRDEKRLRATLELLLADGAHVPSASFLARWLPSVEPCLFYQCLNALRNGGSFFQRYRLGRKLRKQLASFKRLSVLGTAALLLRLLLQEGVFRLLRGRRPRKQLAAGGAAIAFVGPDASGKSTLARETAAWLGSAFRIRSAHLGKPPATCLTFLPNLARRLLRWVFPRLRAADGVPGGGTSASAPGGLLHCIRDVLVAWDRRALAVRLHRLAANGQLVVCDRYPSPVVGALDSAVQKVPAAPSWFSLRGALARLENWLYRQVPPPYVLFRLVVPVEVALERNRDRRGNGQDESDGYILRIHQNLVMPSFANAQVIEVDTTRPQAETVQAIRRALWDLL